MVSEVIQKLAIQRIQRFPMRITKFKNQQIYIENSSLGALFEFISQEKSIAIVRRSSINCAWCGTIQLRAHLFMAGQMGWRNTKKPSRCHRYTDTPIYQSQEPRVSQLLYFNLPREYIFCALQKLIGVHYPASLLSITFLD